MAFGYAIVALVMFIRIITIPFRIASARIALFCLVVRPARSMWEGAPQVLPARECALASHRHLGLPARLPLRAKMRKRGRRVDGRLIVVCSGRVDPVPDALAFARRERRISRRHRPLLDPGRRHLLDHAPYAPLPLSLRAFPNSGSG